MFYLRQIIVMKILSGNIIISDIFISALANSRVWTDLLPSVYSSSQDIQDLSYLWKTFFSLV